jgi:hypothetical protein
MAVKDRDYDRARLKPPDAKPVAIETLEVPDAPSGGALGYLFARAGGRRRRSSLSLRVPLIVILIRAHASLVEGLRSATPPQGAISVLNATRATHHSGSDESNPAS